ncbi:Signal transduction histidine kinase [Sphingomonas gellani]|uniref:histidine kinase n=1 Tax=Sphingomonas gellani TaxID=1166340 RepID=A0A1H8D030_9SPHN|nr:HAMP domain-containing sensor histidine kinase [Sphingomonas gellani]SEM99984.1 Signal transduction histidine kinase [Sphingomonas gellani]
MQSLRTLTVAFLALFALATGLTGYATYTTARRTIAMLVDRRIAAVADTVLEDVAPGDRATILARIDTLSRRRDTGDIGFELIDPRGTWLGGNVALPRRPPVGLSTLHGTDRIAGLSTGRALVRDAGHGLRLAVIAETEPVEGYGPVRLRNAVIGFGAIALVVLGGTVMFGLLIRRRIGDMRSTAEAIVDGDLSRRVPVPAGGGAFAAQAVAFNHMLDRIVALMTSLRHVSADVAHDMRTPLARLRAKLERLANDATSTEQAAALEDAIAQCDALLAMFGAVLRITEVESGSRHAAFATIDIVSLAADVVDSLSPLATKAGQYIAMDAPPALTVTGDAGLLGQALMNLAENALNHTPAGARVRVSIHATGERATVCVEDDGLGIAPADRALALRRFGRLDASRHRPGHGLGLPLADAIARLHGGALVLDDARPGLRACFTLPVAN